MPFLIDGFRTIITMSLLPDGVYFREVSVTPPALDGKGEIDFTSMRNQLYRTKAPKSLVDIGNIQAEVQYDSRIYTAMSNVLNKIQFITVTFPDLQTMSFYGFLTRFTPSALREGENPRATIEIVVGNIQPISYIEQPPIRLPN